MDLEGLLRNTDDYHKPEKCTECGGRMDYKGLGEYKCSDCNHIDYDDYGKVRLFLEKNPGANIIRAEAATGVPQRLIKQMIKEGRFAVGGRRVNDPKGE